MKHAERLASCVELGTVHEERDDVKLASKHGMESVKCKNECPPSPDQRSLYVAGWHWSNLRQSGHKSGVDGPDHIAASSSVWTSGANNHCMVLRSNLREMKNWFDLDTTGNSWDEPNAVPIAKIRPETQHLHERGQNGSTCPRLITMMHRLVERHERDSDRCTRLNG